MKTIVNYCIILCVLLIVSLINFGWAKSAYSADNLVYHSQEVIKDNKIISTFNLTQYNINKLYQYVIINSDILIVLGTKEDGENILAAIYSDRNELSVITEYSTALSWAMPDAKFMISLSQKKQEGFSYIIVEYISGNFSRHFDERETYIDVYSFDIGGKHTMINQEKIAMNNIVTVMQTDLKDKYKYLAVDDSVSGPGQILPASQEIAKLVLTDINSDGSTDILIWQKIFLSRLIKETDKDDFVFDSEQLYAMYFNKDTKTFSKLTPVNWE